MSEILFKRLQIENFLSIGEGAIDLDNRGLLLIQGVNNDETSANSNGAGKSSTVDALCWALYGTTARGKSGDGVVNRFEGKNCRVEITFTLNGKLYSVTRHRKHTKGKNRLTFTCDGADLTLGTDKLTQDSIEKTIGCNLEVFTASIYSGQNSMPNLPAMTDKELKQLVEKAAGIELLDSAYTIARERLKTAQVQHDTLNTVHVLKVRNHADQQSRVDSVKDSEARWQGEQDARIKAAHAALVAKVVGVQALANEIAELDEPALLKNVEILEAKLVEANKPLPEIVAPVSPGLERQPAEPARLLTLRAADIPHAEREAKSFMTKLQATVNSVRNIDATVGTDCTSCGKAYHKEDLESRRAILTAEASTLKDQVLRANISLKLLQEELEGQIIAHQLACKEVDDGNQVRQAAYQRELDAHKIALQARRDAIASSDSTKIMASLRSAQNELQHVSKKKHEHAAQLAQIKTDKAQLDALKTAVNPLVSVVAESERQLAELKEVAAAAWDLVSKQLDRVEDLKVVSDLFSPKGMRGEILDGVTPFLNARTSQYLGALSDGTMSADWKTIGETAKGELREKFHIDVQSTNGSEDFDGMSGGEQRKVRISTAMALQDLVASRADRPIKLFIADEADDALDVSGLERLMGVLDDKARHVGTVLVISHADLGDWISQQITVVKSGGTSHIVEL